MIMDDTLCTTAYLLSVLGLWGSVKTGQLTLSKGVLTLERRGIRDPLFSVPVDEVRARFPRLYFGLGLQLITRGKKHRIWFIPISGTGGGGQGFWLKDVGPARSTTQTWRTALSGTGT
jgi:hypothetical protein